MEYLFPFCMIFFLWVGFYAGGVHPILGHKWGVYEMGIHVAKHLFMADGFYGLTGTFWFLRSLFWGLVIYGVFDYFLRKLLGDKLGMVFLSVLAFVMLQFSCAGYLRPICYVGGASMMTAFCLIHVGVLLHLFDLGVEGLCWRRIALLVGICVFFLMWLGRTGDINLDCNEYPGPLVLLCCSVCGWFFLGGVARILGGGSLGKNVSFVGRHTMPILLFHFAAFKIVSALGILFGHEGSMSAFPCSFWGWGWCLAYTFTGISVPLLLWWVYSQFGSWIRRE